MLNNSKFTINNSKRQGNETINRLNRVEGQIRGIKRMYEDEQGDCISLITQIQAARGALGKVAELVLSDEAQKCVDKGDIKRLKEIVASMHKST